MFSRNDGSDLLSLKLYNEKNLNWAILSPCSAIRTVYNHVRLGTAGQERHSIDS